VTPEKEIDILSSGMLDFANAVINDQPVPTPLNDAIGNMQVIDALFESSKKEGWVHL
jgi:hypothetical protein